MNSFISWVGGKKLLRNEICNIIPEKIDRYVEVFGGAGWVLFNKDRHASEEIYNDYNSELVSLFRCAKYHYPELQRELSFVLNSREVFHNFLDEYKKEGKTDIQRAARFMMLVKTSYGSKYTTFGGKPINLNNMSEYLNLVSARLARVIIENKDFEDLIISQDKEKTLFYLDPPYYETEKYYQNVDFKKEDHVRLYNLLKNVKGKFILSYNDCDYIRELYKDYNIKEVCRFNNLSFKTKEFKELIITNY